MNIYSTLGIDWEHLHLQKPPPIQPYLPMTSEGKADIKGANRYSRVDVDQQIKMDMENLGDILSLPEGQELSQEKKELLEKQAATSIWHR